MRTKFFFLTFVFFFSNFLRLDANKISSVGTNPTKSIFSKIAHSDIVNVTIKTDLNELINNRKRDTYQKGEIYYSDKRGQSNHFSIQLKPRGKYRRKICDFPPIKIKFSKDDLFTKGLSKSNKLKLVTHCMDNKALSKENILREYLAYKLYNEITDASFRVQLLLVKYEDITGGMASIERYAFLIEDIDDVSQRAELTKAKKDMNIPIDKVDDPSALRVSIFQYLIGNADWDYTTPRNIKYLNKGAKLLPVPYDFDFSGLVNAFYAIPNTDIGLKNVKDRGYIGKSYSRREVEKTLAIYNMKKDKLLSVVNNFRLLSKKSRKEIEQYVIDFYKNQDELLKAATTSFVSQKNN